MLKAEKRRIADRAVRLENLRIHSILFDDDVRRHLRAPPSLRIQDPSQDTPEEAQCRKKFIEIVRALHADFCVG